MGTRKWLMVVFKNMSTFCCQMYVELPDRITVKLRESIEFGELELPHSDMVRVFVELEDNGIPDPEMYSFIVLPDKLSK